ncbi:MULTISPECIES: DUF4188 domain-containing protein [Novosphingobium]|uniref:DUF4188 domain-containing protein n=1 Tax=Novosphingobium TaxID=165696 RepID=UPI001CD7DFEC|nr:DUF4188 domain-containing protein [Novosphingobium percolationis]MCH7628839.1 DUF4188 domain-containing protein [Pseudomonadota bacterium]
MAKIIPARMTAAHDGPLVVFLIGMRFNKLHRIDKWLPVVRAMGPMIAELARDPDSGFLGWQPSLAGLRTLLLTQYWRDFEALETYARARDRLHWPAWIAFNKAVGTDGSVGIFHETYAVPAGGYETIYANMPPFGLGKVAGLVPATGNRNAARERMKASRI